MKLNGNLVGNADGSTEIRNISIEKLDDAAQGALSLAQAHKGRIIFNTTTTKYKYWDGAAWQDFATGGAAASQADFDNLVASMGYVTADGSFTEAALNALTNISGLTSGSSLVDALSLLSDAIDAAAGVDTLPELSDVTVTGQAVNDFIVADSASSFVNLNGAAARAALGTVIGIDVQAFNGDLADLAALAHADGNIIVSDGTDWTVESGDTARASLGLTIGTNVQAFDAELTDLAALAHADGNIIVSDGTDWTVESGAVARTSLGLTIGTNVQAQDAGLQSISDLTTAADQLIYTTGVDTYATAAFTAFGRDVVDSADEAAARATLGLESGGAGDIWLEKTGDTMSGVINMGGNAITNLPSPVAVQDAVNKQYVDGLAGGLDTKESVRVSTTANVDLTAGGLLVVDGVTTVAGDRVLVRAQTDAKENGIYTAESGSWVRAADQDGSPANEVSSGNFTFVEAGTVNAGTGWVLLGDGILTLTVDDLNWTQFSFAGEIGAGIGLSNVGNVMHVNMGAGIAQLPSDEVGLDLGDLATSALIMSLDASPLIRSTDTDAKLRLLLQGSTLNQDADGLEIAAAGVTEVELNTSVAGDGITGGAGTALSVDADGHFEFTAGVLGLVDGSVENAKLTNSTITVAGDTGSSTRALGSTLTVAGGTGVTTTEAAGTVTVALDGVAADLNDVPVGVAETVLVRNAGNTAYETKTAAEFVAAAGIDDLSDVDTTGAVDGSILVNDGTNFVAQKTYHLYTGTSSTSHNVVHSIGQKFCNVTVVDGTDEVIIPQSITFTDANSLVVTFNTAIDCKVVVMGIA